MANALRISEATSLALHTTVLLAAHSDGLLSTREIAATLGVSEAHLSKVLQRLGRVGLVKSIRGPRGGFRLGKPGDKITLLDVYQAIEGRLAAHACLLGARVCRGEQCVLGGLLGAVNKQLKDYLAQTRLSELIHVYDGARG
jgi:Rrf2 family protein